MNDLAGFFRDEFADLHLLYPAIQLIDISAKQIKDPSFLASCSKNLQVAHEYFDGEFDKATALNDMIKERLSAQYGSLANVKNAHHNEKLEEFVTDKQAKNVVANNRIIRKENTIFIASPRAAAPFYAYSKTLFGIRMETIWFNVIVIWLMTITLYVTLYFDLLRKLIEKRK